MKHIPIIDREHPVASEGSGSGTQQVYRFPNGYGASVVRFMLGSFGGSYGAEDGLYELGVLAFDGEKYKLTYETPITNDVMGRLTPEQVEETLDRIATLPPNPAAYQACVKRQEEARASLKKFAEEHKETA